MSVQFIYHHKIETQMLGSASLGPVKDEQKYNFSAYQFQV